MRCALAGVLLYDIAAVRADIVQFEVFEGARHAKLWNHDPERWTRLLEEWLAAR